MMEQVWHVIPHFEALKKFYNESDLLFVVHILLLTKLLQFIVG